MSNNIVKLASYSGFLSKMSQSNSGGKSGRNLHMVQCNYDITGSLDSSVPPWTWSWIFLVHNNTNDIPWHQYIPLHHMVALCHVWSLTGFLLSFFKSCVRIYEGEVWVWDYHYVSCFGTGGTIKRYWYHYGSKFLPHADEALWSDLVKLMMYKLKTYNIHLCFIEDKCNSN